ncbi:MAG: flagellar hook assembly protein FlgD [Beijerinckiaceae bacterium]|jgi:flagellar basal-body rod modification protein FlgD|nr:flagellar hook assembly protein FlgD [Beijerinckiaceae bacterium]MDO9440545.1 flagellar hook assembly protein FlgD [Beijerinckiaceae bacterium]
MIVNPTSAAGTPTSPAATKALDKNTVDYNSFLKLLVTQMQNQDPTEPMESSQFLSQLASFSNVEQSVQLNSKIESLVAMSQISQADGLIGKLAASADGLTKGVVKSVKIDATGVTATLDTGATLNVTSGITISAA